MSIECKTKRECKEICNEHGLIMYQKDINKSYQKNFLATTHDDVYNEIFVNKKNNFYEHLSKQPLKLYIDYDKKDVTDSDLTHKADILNIITVIRQYIKDISNVYILKSIPNTTKHSYHLIFEGVHFSGYTNIKTFMNDYMQTKFPELFSKKIIDTTVYADKCFRSLMCTKFGQDRLLYLLDTDKFVNELIEDVVIEIPLELFKRTCITHIPANSVLFTYKSIDKKKDNNNKKIHLLNEEGDIYSDKDIAKKYLDILDPSRYNDRNKWLNVGYILYSIDSNYNDIWHYFSEKWDNYNKNDCETAWDSFSGSENIYTIHDLIYLAKIDSSNDYMELYNDIHTHDIKFLKPFDNLISKLIYRIYGEKFVCSNPEKNEWYYYNNIRWIKENKSHNLRKLTINEVYPKVEEHRRQLVKDCANEDLIKNYHNILRILGSGIKLNCLELEFYNDIFYKIIDQNKSLLGFENGIYDLNTMEFRKGNPSDYISMSVGYEYKTYVDTDSEWIELMDLIEKIFPIKDVREFTLKALSSCLDGYIRDEKFYIFSGKHASGGNGKTTITELQSVALGDYAYSPPVSLITAKRESPNSPNSALYGIRNKRFILMQEPDSNEQIQTSIIKGYTGGDKVSCRELNNTQVTFIPMGKFFVCANQPPPLSETDGGISRRLLIIEFVSQFVDKPSGKYEYEYKIDRELKNKLKDYAPVYMCILLKYYEIYKREGLTPPDSVLQATRKYENDNNMIKQFVEENIINGDKTMHIIKNELKELFLKDSILKSTFRKFSTFIKQIENNLCSEFRPDKKNPSIHKLFGYRLKTDQDIMDDNETDYVADC